MSPTRSIAVRVAALSLAFSSVAACGDSSQSSADPHLDAVGHIHAIGENPADEMVYIATHTGVYRLTSGGFELIANRRHDTMGFVIAGPNEFLASGHPDPASTDPNPLGLIRSTDLAKTWVPVAFAGTQDFHAIDVAAGQTYAYGSSGELMTTKDQKTWKTLSRAELIDIAADPTSPGRVLGTTTSGQLVTFDDNGNVTPASASSGAAPMALIDFTEAGSLVGVDPSGQVFASDSQLTNWEKLAVVPGVPAAISMRGDTWYVGTDSVVYSSTDAGQSWQKLVGIQM